MVFRRFLWTPDARGPLEMDLGRRNPQHSALIPCFSPNQDFPFPTLGSMEEEEAVRKRRIPQEPQAGEQEITAPFPLWGDLLPLPSGTEANPILSLSFLPQTKS